MSPAFDQLVEKLAVIRSRIEGVERPYDHSVEVIPVTKGFGADAVSAAAAAGCRAVGENYAQDLLTKADVIHELGLDVQFIGHLQSNKVRQLVGVVTLWCTLDRASIIAEVAKRAPEAHVLLQVNATGEDRKGGCPPAEVGDLIDRARTAGLVVDGLMTIGPTDRPAEAARPAFRLVRSLVEDHGLEICSMGMTGDLEVAVECGSNQVRVGSALFGPRPGVGRPGSDRSVSTNREQS